VSKKKEYNALLNFGTEDCHFQCAGFELDLTYPVIMGILNITPDSFSDGGMFFEKNKALDHALKMQSDGAQVIDIGAASTRPGAEEIPPAEQLQRIEDVVKVLAKKINIPISIDTTSSLVAKRCLDLGVSIINDISALRTDAVLGEVVAQYKAGVILMHMQGEPATMQKSPEYKDVILEITQFLDKSVKHAMSFGIDKQSIIIDPGIGFGKTTEHNLAIIKFLSDFKVIGMPILVGTSRKSFIGNILDAPISERQSGTLTSNIIAVLNGANILRVHDVKSANQMLKVTDAIYKQSI